MRPDMVLDSECQCILYFIELRISYVIKEAFERKKINYAEMVAEAREQGWEAHTTRPV